MRMFVHRSSRLELRPLRLGDYAAWFKAYTQHGPAKNRWDHDPYPVAKCSPQMFKNLVQRLRALAQKDEYYRYHVFLRSTGELVGHVDFNIYERGCLNYANFGYILHSSFWGRGYGTEMGRLALWIGHRRLKLQRLEAATDLDNRRSQRLARRIGMRSDGIRKAYWWQEGRWDDQRLFVSVGSDYSATGPAGE